MRTVRNVSCAAIITGIIICAASAGHAQMNAMKTVITNLIVNGAETACWIKISATSRISVSNAWWRMAGIVRTVKHASAVTMTDSVGNAFAVTAVPEPSVTSAVYAKNVRLTAVMCSTVRSAVRAS